MSASSSLSESRPPSRFVVDPNLRREFGAIVDSFAARLIEGDPLADAVVTDLQRQKCSLDAQTDRVLFALRNPSSNLETELESVRALADQLRQRPSWLNETRLVRGSEVLLAAGPFGSIALFAALFTSYLSPAGNKPLLFTRRLEHDVERRLAETGQFVYAVSQRDHLELDSAAMAWIVRVRLLHANVRSGLLRSNEWKASDWGTPINQLDMSSTVILFSSWFAWALRRIGIAVAADEMDALIHRWRFIGTLLGVDAPLLAKNEMDARQFWTIFQHTQRPPDDDTMRLVDALAKAVREPSTATRAENQVGRLVLETAARALQPEHAAFLRERISKNREEDRAIQRARSSLVQLTCASNHLATRIPNFSALRLRIGSLYWRWSENERAKILQRS